MSRELFDAQCMFTEKQMHQIVSKCLGSRCSNGWQVVACDRRPASTGLSGFLGDHARVTLHVKYNGLIKKIRLFVKTMPASNAPKAHFIDTNGYFKREAVALRLAEEMHGADGPIPWTVRTYLCNDSMVVMPDLAAQGYRTLKYYETLSLPHVMLAAASLARFHASFANYATARTARDGTPYSFLQEHGDVVTEPTFCDSPWLRAAAKLSYNLLKTFSNKFAQYPQNLEALLAQRYLESCTNLAEHKGTLNVMLHKDMWVNNVMFKYDGDEPINALLIDFQCLRYGPPAFDLMVFLYLTTERDFRERHEEDVIRQYFSVFSESLEENTRVRLRDMKYNMEELVLWCEKSRMFGMFEAVGIFPYVLMEPLAAQKTFDDADTFMRYCDEDRSAPVLAHCRADTRYLCRQLHLTEEFVERYIMEHPTLPTHTITT